MGTVYFIAVGLGAFWIFPSASPDAIVCATLISSQIEVSCPLQYTPASSARAGVIPRIANAMLIANRAFVNPIILKISIP
jgi:hypothetical protein